MADVRMRRALENADVILRRDYGLDGFGEDQWRSLLCRFVELAVLHCRGDQYFAQKKPLGHFAGTAQSRLHSGQFLDEVRGLLFAPWTRRQARKMMHRAGHAQLAALPFRIE